MIYARCAFLSTLPVHVLGVCCTTALSHKADKQPAFPQLLSLSSSKVQHCAGRFPAGRVCGLLFHFAAISAPLTLSYKARLKYLPVTRLWDSPLPTFAIISASVAPLPTSPGASKHSRTLQAER